MNTTATKYVTRYGDTMDAICYRHYGNERGGTTETVLEANIGLAEYGAVLPAGVVVVLPALALPARVKTLINLWD